MPEAAVTVQYASDVANMLVVEKTTGVDDVVGPETVDTEVIAKSA